MNEMKKYFEEQMENVGQAQGVEIESRLTVVNSDNEMEALFTFEGDTGAAALCLITIVSGSGQPQEIVNESPNVFSVRLTGNQIYQFVESFEAKVFSEGPLDPILEDFIDSLRSIL